MLASTVQFSTYDQSPPTHPRRPTPSAERWRYENRRALSEKKRSPGSPGGPLSQDPTACLRTDPHPSPRSMPRRAVLAAADDAGRTGQCSTLEHCHGHQQPPGDEEPSRPEHSSGPPARGWRPVLLRKEVIQPHLPVRLPCYDFVPIADPAFDGSLHKGWATGFGRYRLS